MTDEQKAYAEEVDAYIERELNRPPLDLETMYTELNDYFKVSEMEVRVYDDPVDYYANPDNASATIWAGKWEHADWSEGLLIYVDELGKVYAPTTDEWVKVVDADNLFGEFKLTRDGVFAQYHRSSLQFCPITQLRSTQAVVDLITDISAG